MLRLFVFLQTLKTDRRGVTAIEYAVLAGAVAVALVAVMGGTDEGSVGAVLKDKLTSIVDSIPTVTE